MPVGNWARGAEVRIVGSLHGSQTENVFHVATDEVANDQDALNALLLQLAQAMLLCVIDTLLPAVSQDWSVTRVEAIEVFPTRSDPIVATADPGSVGELGVTSVSFAASLLNLRTGGGGRSGRGKKFLPPAGEAQIANSAIDGPTLALIAAFAACIAEKFMGVNPTSSWHLGIFSRKNGGANFANFNQGFRLVTSINPVADVARMGSRKKGRGA